MKITRNGVEIELTREEMLKAYSVIEVEYREEDAERQLYEFVFNNDADDVMKLVNEKKFLLTKYNACLIDFSKRYGKGFFSLVSPNSADYAIPALAKKFCENCDCNIDENSMWEIVIKEYLEGLK